MFKHPYFIITFIFISLACFSTPGTPINMLPPTRTATPTVTITPFYTRTPTPGPTVAVAVTPTYSGICAVTTLGYWEHISSSGSLTQTQWQASGGMACRIARDSCAFRYLVGNRDEDIVFKAEEKPPYNREDVLMHPDMLLPLTRLKELVATEWDGEVKLRVTDTYDSLLEHDLYQGDTTKRVSLHFEGRAIDLTLWPIKREYYNRLCALAHCAGFDWVHNEGDHCHASINAESLCYRCR